MSEGELRAVLAAAMPLGRGIGGSALRTRVAGHGVFVKKVPVTEFELLPDTVGSTANLFDLPLFYQYGVGSAGFGAWRELAALLMTTGWVLDGSFAGFPLTYYVRTLMEPLADVAQDLDLDSLAKRLEEATRRWGGSTAVRRRLVALERAPASIVVFMEFIPWRLSAWVRDRVEEGGAALDAALVHAAAELGAGAEFMASRGLVHFDAHRGNVLTDGSHFYFADFGLALSETFALTSEEAAFLHLHKDYDWMMAMADLVNSVGAALRGEEQFFNLAADYARARADPDALPTGSAALVRRLAPAAVRLNTFIWDLVSGSKTTPYPAGEFAAALRRAKAIPLS